MPIHEHNQNQLNSLESRRALMISKALTQAKNKKKETKVGLINYIDNQTEIYSQIYFGKKMWKLSIE